MSTTMKVLVIARHVKYKDHKDNLEIVGPSVAQCIKLAERDSPVISDMLGPLKLSEKMVVIVPVNNSSSADQEGTHW